MRQLIMSLALTLAYSSLAQAKCFENSVPALNASVNEQSDFIKELNFKSDFSECNVDELNTAKQVISKNIILFKTQYDQTNDPRYKVSFLALGADLKATLALINQRVAELAAQK